ncbi:hypothetical protein INT48_006797 [Thamnidium elegans]|uniref:Uncharacterized protein n=1 Tax=Thamnidium elegans TaxID=101142 RepID=A0A8H7SLJ7_9FUNG|nr:hypothetical protein INT48_006797 [Thamnidium elegans]
MKHLSLSREARAYIEESLNEGYRKHGTKLSIQVLCNSFSEASNAIVHRDQSVHADEAHKIYKKIQETFYKYVNDQKESFKIRLDELVANGYKTFVGNHYDTAFSFGFSYPGSNSNSITSMATNIFSGMQNFGLNMETNNFVESWHNQSKTTYLERKRNERADRLIFILVNDIEPDFIEKPIVFS